MTLPFAVFTFFNVWWIMMFFVTACMARPVRWKKALIVNTLLSLAATGVLALIIKSGLVPLRDVY